MSARSWQMMEMTASPLHRCCNSELKKRRSKTRDRTCDCRSVKSWTRRDGRLKHVIAFVASNIAVDDRNHRLREHGSAEIILKSTAEESLAFQFPMPTVVWSGPLNVAHSWHRQLECHYLFGRLSLWLEYRKGIYVQHKFSLAVNHKGSQQRPPHRLLTDHLDQQ